MAGEIPAAEVMQDVYNYMVREMEPLKKDLFEFWDNLTGTRITLWESLRGNQISRLMEEQRTLSTRWIGAREKVVRLEAFISPEDPQGKLKIVQLLSQPVIMESMRQDETDVGTMMRDIQDVLRGLRIEADFKRSGIISSIAIMLASASVIVTVVMNTL